MFLASYISWYFSFSFHMFSLLRTLGFKYMMYVVFFLLVFDIIYASYTLMGLYLDWKSMIVLKIFSVLFVWRSLSSWAIITDF